MIKSKLHNPIIANNSQLENAVIEKVTNEKELVFSNLASATPVVPETGRIWFNTDKGQFHFANVGKGGDDKNFVDEFLSRTDTRHQQVVSSIDFQNTLKINAVDSENIVTVDSSTKAIKLKSSSLNVTTTENNEYTVGGTDTKTVTGKVTHKFLSDSLVEITGNFVETVGGTFTITVAGDAVENFSSNKQINVANNFGVKVAGITSLTDDSGNIKISANNTTNALTINYSTTNFTGQTETHTLSNKFVVNDGVTDKFIIDNTNDKLTVNYKTIESTSNNVKINATKHLILTDGTNEKINANHETDTLTVKYSDITVTGNTTVDGNMVITGDLTVGGQTTKVDVASENLRIADNVIVLNSNLTNTTDPRLANALVEGEDVDYNAGVAVNRGSEGILEIIKWVESVDTTTSETLKNAVAKTSIWNFEAATPAYELHQIIDAYTLGRKTPGKSGAKWVGYDGYAGINFTASIAAGAPVNEVLDYSYKLDAAQLDDTVDSIAQEIDSIKFDKYNTKRVGETPSAGTEFTITHNLGTVFVQVTTQREDNGVWLFDVLPIQVIDKNTIKIMTSETTKIRYMIAAFEGFDVNQATELVIV